MESMGCRPLRGLVASSSLVDISLPEQLCAEFADDGEGAIEGQSRIKPSQLVERLAQTMPFVQITRNFRLKSGPNLAKRTDATARQNAQLEALVLAAGAAAFWPVFLATAAPRPEACESSTW
jgi:hypothetical protein